jgi:alkylhydroperoxidase/carboxymuconolactone decarboxylase family protein YurZ
MRAAGSWNSDWDIMAELDADWTERFMHTVARPLRPGVLDPKTFELASIAVDAAVTHMYAPGTRRHIRRALDIGVTPEEILAVLQLTTTVGVHGLAMAAPILREELKRREAA